ncbi:MAG: SRPBCC domain-containing protein, partial [Ignavibacteria bacterium]|nr:SRPBCC domain-containing protein [Ignavibacteria bacterium]
MSEQKENQVNELVITREFDAPRDMVWKAWSDAEALAQWWGPKEFGI